MPATIDRFGTLRNKKLAATLAVTAGSCPHVHGAVAVGASNALCTPAYYDVDAGAATIGFLGSLYGTNARLINMGPDLVTVGLFDDYAYPGADRNNPTLWANLVLGLGTGSIGVGVNNYGGPVPAVKPTSFTLSPSLLAVYDFTVYLLGTPAFPAGYKPAFDPLDQPCATVLTGNSLASTDFYGQVSTFLETDLKVRVTVTIGDGSAAASKDRTGLPLGYNVALSGFADARAKCQWWADACANAISNTDPAGYRDYYSAVEQLNGSYLLRPYGATNFPAGGPAPISPRPYLPVTPVYKNATATTSDVTLAGCATPDPCPNWPPGMIFTGAPATLVVRRRLILTHYRRLVVQTAIKSGGRPGSRASGFGDGFGGSVGNQFVYRRAATDLWPQTGSVTLTFDPTPTDPVTGEPGSDPVYPGVTVPATITLTPTGYTP